MGKYPWEFQELPGEDVVGRPGDLDSSSMASQDTKLGINVLETTFTFLAGWVKGHLCHRQDSRIQYLAMPIVFLSFVSETLNKVFERDFIRTNSKGHVTPQRLKPCFKYAF